MTRRRLRIVALLTAVAAVGVLLWLRSEPSKAPFLDYVADLRAHGEPVTVAEFIGPAPDPADNAADAVMSSVGVESAARAAGLTGLWDESTSEPWYEVASAAQLRSLHDHLDRLRTHFDALDAASRRRHLWQPLARGNETILVSDEALHGLRSTWALLDARAVVAGDSDVRVRSIEALLRLSSLCDGTELRPLQGAAMRKGAAIRVRAALTPGADALVGARRRLDPLLASDCISQFPAIARAHRASMVEYFGGLLDGTIRPQEKDDYFASQYENWAVRRILGLWGNRGVPFGSAEDYVQACRFIESMASIPTSSPAVLSREVDSRIAALGKYTAARAAAVIYTKAARKFAESDATTRLARIALAAAEHRATHGDFPASLDELQPMFPDGLPLDPYTDAPFAYARTATGARIASLGRLPEETPLDDATLRERVLVWELKR